MDPLTDDIVEQTSTISDAHYLVGMQIRAFFHLADVEEVDIAPEITKDILATIPEDVINEFLLIQQDESTKSGLVPPDLSVLFASSDNDETWTKQERNSMLHHLKEYGISAFIQKYVVTRQIPILKLLKAFRMNLCPEFQAKPQLILLSFLNVAMSRELRRREKLPQFNTIKDAVDLIRSSKRILILTGAGISVSCGIPDFRSRNGVYASLNQYDLDDPQQMFDMDYFKENPAVFYSFAHKIYPSNFIPSPCHRFVKLIEEKGKLLRNYTQNIDTLETLVGIQRVIQCHGSFATATCLFCETQVPGKAIEREIFERKVALCKVCNTRPKSPPKTPKKKSKKKAQGKWDSEDEDESDYPAYPPGVMKPDITFFGEKLSTEFDRAFDQDKPEVDLILVIGTSLRVAPVGNIVYHFRHSIPQILINKTPVRHINPDIILLGNADDIVQHLCNELEWELPPPIPLLDEQGVETGNRPLKRALYDIQTPSRVGDSHVWLFEGADGGKWLCDLMGEHEPPQSLTAETVPLVELVAQSSDQVDEMRANKRPRM
ncbi:SIR2-domain-containing protein [Mycena floridula]|nr:SIR2-domain-containing protein [Mycena floridula]